MEQDKFGCERIDIESMRHSAQRNILIAEYCSDNFNFFNLVDFYYRKTNSNAILIFLIICTVYPVLFMYIAAVADKYLSVGMQDLSKRFKLSPTLAAVTLIAFAKEHLADFKVPQYVVVRNEPLPRNPGGKVLKPPLRTETEWPTPLR